MNLATPAFVKAKQLVLKASRPLKVAAHAVHSAYKQTTKLDKLIMAVALMFAGGSAVWAETTSAGNGGITASGAGNQVSVLDVGGKLALQYKSKLNYSMSGPHAHASPTTGWADCSSWVSFVDKATQDAINKIAPSIGLRSISLPQATASVMATQSLKDLVWSKAPGGKNASGALPQLKPGMLIFQGPGANYGGNPVHVGGTIYTINHVQIVVRVAGKIYITDARGGRDGLQPVMGTSGAGGVNFYNDIAGSTPMNQQGTKPSSGSMKGYLITDPLAKIRTLIGDSATTTLDLNTLASGETPNQGEIGGKAGIFGQPPSGSDSQIEGGGYAAQDGDVSGTGYSAMLHDAVMGRTASSAYQRGLAGASEPRLIAELAYIRTLQNIMMQGMRESKARQEALTAAYATIMAKAAESNKLASQAALAAQAGGAQAVQVKH